MHLMRFVAVGALALAAACGGSSSTDPGGGNTPPPPGNSVVDVTIQDFSFSPSTVTIKVGTAVRWTNSGPSSHTTTSDVGVWDSGTLSPPGGGGGYSGGGSPGGSFSFTFEEAGSYPYHCTLHPPADFPGFTGTVTVSP